MPKKNPKPTEEELVDAIAEVLLAIDLSRSPPPSPSTEPGQVDPMIEEGWKALLRGRSPDLTDEEIEELYQTS